MIVKQMKTKSKRAKKLLHLMQMHKEVIGGGLDNFEDAATAAEYFDMGLHFEDEDFLNQMMENELNSRLTCKRVDLDKIAFVDRDKANKNKFIITLTNMGKVDIIVDEFHNVKATNFYLVRESNGVEVEYHGQEIIQIIGVKLR